jgi:hypothetical protein
MRQRADGGRVGYFGLGVHDSGSSGALDAVCAAAWQGGGTRGWYEATGRVTLCSPHLG